MAETSKIRTDELKTRADLAQQLDALDKSRAAGAAAYKAELEATLPRLEESLNRLQRLNASTRLTDTSVLYKSLVVGTFVGAVMLMISVLTTVWGSFSTAVIMAIYGISASSRRKPSWLETIKGRLPFVTSTATSLFSIATKWLEIFFFVALTVPLFNLATHALGSDLTLQSVIRDLSQLHLQAAVSKVRSVLIMN